MKPFTLRLNFTFIHTSFSSPGITETIAQLASGWVTDRNLFHKYHFHKAYLILCGLVNMLSPLATSYILLMVYAVFFAIFCGGYMALLLPVLVRKTNDFCCCWGGGLTHHLAILMPYVSYLNQNNIYNPEMTI